MEPGDTSYDAGLRNSQLMEASNFHGVLNAPGLGWLAAAFTLSATVVQKQGKGTPYFQPGNGRHEELRFTSATNVSSCACAVNSMTAGTNTHRDRASHVWSSRQHTRENKPEAERKESQETEFWTTVPPGGGGCGQADEPRESVAMRVSI